MTTGLRPVPSTGRAWAEWRHHPSPYTVGIEEEAMLLHPGEWKLSHNCETVLAGLPEDIASHATAETHGSALELATGVHTSIGGAIAELSSLRAGLAADLQRHGLSVASAGTHPFAVWSDTVVSAGERYQFLYGSMRELARREPTHALHVHVGVPSGDQAICVANRMRAHLPLLLALSGSSPFWQGRDTGLASARTPLFQAFPRTGVPRGFHDYDDWVGAVDTMIKCGAFPDPSFLWWDVRLQPRFGTVEVRIMDAQATTADTGALTALVQCLVRLECEEEGWASEALMDLPEAIHENRFLAARDGMAASFLDPAHETAVPARTVVKEVLAACAPHAEELGCEHELARVVRLAELPCATWQRDRAAAGGLRGLVADLADAYVDFRG
ncbi:MAG: glutamate---cysteine ligase / carboxylate-amine ligase [Thermoleophilaceae bacterium]|nr:glutamate---cysteine ligase / carboxylate-amine ligase [Thermoleophilaceae bacterium]